MEMVVTMVVVVAEAVAIMTVMIREKISIFL